MRPSPPPPRPAPLRILFSPYALGNAYGEKRDRGGGGTAVIPALFGIPTQHRRKQRGAAPFFLPPLPPPPLRAVTWLLPPCRDAHSKSPPSRHVATVPRAPAAPRPPLAPDPPCPTGAAGKGTLASPSRGKHCDAGAPQVRGGSAGAERGEQRGGGGRSRDGTGMERGWSEPPSPPVPRPPPPTPPPLVFTSSLNFICAT